MALPKKLQKLASNAFFLYISFGANLLLPLLVLPHLAASLGKEAFGSYVFVTAVTYFFSLLVTFGFNLTATASIAKVQQDKARLSTIFGQVQAAKLLLLFIAAIAYLLLCGLPVFEEESGHLLLGFGWVIGYALYAEWFFLGIEKMFIITAINLLSKIVFAVGIVLTITQPDDLDKSLLWLSASMLIPGVLSVLIALIQYVHIKQLQWHTKAIRREIRMGLPVFLSQSAAYCYSTLNVVAIKLFLDGKTTGHFGIVEKLIVIINSIFVPLNMAIYPWMSRLYVKDAHRFVVIIQRFVLCYVIMAAALSAIMYGLANPLSMFFVGYIDTQLVHFIHWGTLAATTLPIVSFLAGVYTLSGNQSLLLKIFAAIALFNCLLLYPTIQYYRGTGVVLLTGINYLLIGVSAYALWPKPSGNTQPSLPAG